MRGFTIEPIRERYVTMIITKDAPSIVKQDLEFKLAEVEKRLISASIYQADDESLLKRLEHERDNIRYELSHWTIS